VNEPVRKSLRVDCAVEHAFDVFTSRIDLWWPLSHRRVQGSVMLLEAKVGGLFAERTPSGEELRMGEVIRCEPPHAISYTWYPGAIEKPTTVDVRFIDNGDHTVVEVTHSEGGSGMGEQWPQRAQLFARNWGFVLPAYVSCLTLGEEKGVMHDERERFRRGHA
jgi:uncharacterized protein YndB with AHSA1/START domain